MNFLWLKLKYLYSLSLILTLVWNAMTSTARRGGLDTETKGTTIYVEAQRP
jgi:hypothetical protein